MNYETIGNDTCYLPAILSVMGVDNHLP